MKVTCKRELLSNVLKAVSPAVGPGKAYPVLRNVLFDAGLGLTIEANDLEVAIKTTVPETAVDDRGMALLPHRLLSDILDLHADESVTIDGGDYGVKVTFDHSEYDLPGTDEKGFTSRRFAEPKTDGVEVNAKLLAGLVDAVDFAEGKDRTAGVQVSIVEKRINAVCTDGHRLAVAAGELNGDMRDLVLPIKTFELIGSAFGDETVRIRLDGAHFSVVGVNASMVATALANAFPNWRNIVPKDKPKSKFVCNVGDFARTMRQALGQLSAATNMVDVSIDEDQVKVECKEDEGFFASMAFGGKLDGPPVKMLMNPERVTRALKTLDNDGEVTIQSWGADKPWRLESERSGVIFAANQRTK